MTQLLDISIFPRSRVTHVRQNELAECGIACLAMIAGYHGLNVDMFVMRRAFTPSIRGVTLRSLIDIANKLAMKTRAVKVDLEELGSLSLPAVAHWDLNHYVVIERVKSKSILVHDPAGGTRWITFVEASKHFTGVALELEPAEVFETADVRQPLRLSNLWTRVRGIKQAAFQTIILSAMIEILALASPYYLQLAIDSALPELNIGFLGVLALGFIGLTLFNGIAVLLRSSVLLAVGSSFGYGLSTNVARRLFRLPVEWFSRRQVGDVLSRFQSVMPIRKLLTEDAPAAIVDGLFAVLTFAMMFVYSASLSLIAIIAVVVLSIVRLAFLKPLLKAQEGVLVAAGKEQSVLIETVQGIRTLRLAGRESLRHAVWQARLTDAVNGNVRVQRITNWQTSIQTTVISIESVVSIWVGVAIVIHGGFSVGMIFAFQAYKAQFLTATTSLVTKAIDFKMLRLHLDRLSDIALSKEDLTFTTKSESGSPLVGKIELVDISYQYGADDPLVLEKVNLCVLPGESVAITGPSGGGKSTLIQILLGLAEPTRGHVLVDDKPLSKFGYKSYQSQIAAVLQDDTLFGGTLTENISLFDENPNMERVQEAARIASISDDIASMPMRYETLVGEMGNALSGGQRQRVLLARALYRRPRVLVMDEGTSHLDGAREKEVNVAIAAMGITRVIVAHRMETIASAEKIYKLERGRLSVQTYI